MTNIISGINFLAVLFRLPGTQARTAMLPLPPLPLTSAGGYARAGVTTAFRRLKNHAWPDHHPGYRLQDTPRPSHPAARA